MSEGQAVLQSEGSHEVHGHRMIPLEAGLCNYIHLGITCGRGLSKERVSSLLHGFGLFTYMVMRHVVVGCDVLHVVLREKK